MVLLASLFPLTGNVDENCDHGDDNMTADDDDDDDDNGDKDDGAEVYCWQ